MRRETELARRHHHKKSTSPEMTRSSLMGHAETFTAGPTHAGVEKTIHPRCLPQFSKGFGEREIKPHCEKVRAGPASLLRGMSQLETKMMSMCIARSCGWVDTRTNVVLACQLILYFIDLLRILFLCIFFRCPHELGPHE